MNYRKAKQGFTLIELLVVISIIGLLSSVVLASLNTARVKARDARRQLDMNQIWVALNLFYDTYGCLPGSSGTACGGFSHDTNAGGWDYSSQGAGTPPAFLTFLSASGMMPVVPRDPINNIAVDPPVSGTYAYRFYCYTGTPSGPHLGYWSETTGGYVIKNPTTSGGWADSSYICK